MIQKHYDVIVLGRSIGALTAAALLARRDFNVLLVGHAALPATYQVGEHELWRRGFTFLAATSPAWRRVVVELAQSQTWKRRLVPASPMLQAVAPGRRFEVPTDGRRFAREVAREFPGLGRVIEGLYDDLARVNAAADDAFASDATWPPGTFWERRETGRLAAALPYVHAEPDADLLSEFPRGHFYQRMVHASALFASHLSALPPPFAIARHHGNWTRGLVSLPGGEAELEDFLVERVAAHGGTCWLGRKATGVLLRRGVAAGVVLDGDDHSVGCDYVLTDLDGEALAALAGGQGIHKRALREWPRITSTVGRFITSVVVRREGLPEPLGSEALLFTTAPSTSPDRPAALHLQRVDRSNGTCLLVVEMLLPDHGALPLAEARAFVLRSLLAELPFLDRHLLLVDSPHDGLPVWKFDPGPQNLERSSFGLPAQEPMIRQLEVDPPGYLGFAGEPIRGPIERSLLLGRSVLPGLGQEGELLAAWAAAKLVTKSDRRKAMMRRDMWTRMEFG